ncbi:uncharacterized protein ATNIH1004_010463 [Aspergillus tanneri]|uniref:Nucleolar protein Dnt1-like N-terminal domain-containing protein n=2 Tax=Aspergillus tanneri TaxID=1220188 RepID=A0A5M9MGS6_9EURO|nr:uncharacterized protein ATNIH1004_010463 [Aspergillus tanneri]KAA8643689.1 hypothetical protein ATNIH1004_010463 [Aspergillus tanneri]
MVFLRLTVKVYPREQLQSSSSFIRSFLGDRDRDESNRSSSAPGNGKPASFLLALENPEEVTLGGLSGMIQEKWAKLRPNAEPLDIKKLLDDSYESDDLDAEMTVAQVFVDNGKARTDGSDQRGTVRVIQKPAPYAPVRFPSVTQDWDAAAQDYERQAKMKKEVVEKFRFSPIPEEPRRTSSESEPYIYDEQATTAVDINPARERPLSSTDRAEIPGSPPQWGSKSIWDEHSQDRHGSTVAANPQHKRLESQELGDSPPSSPKHTPNMQRSTSKSSSSHGQASSNRHIIEPAEPRLPSQREAPSEEEEEGSSEQGSDEDESGEEEKGREAKEHHDMDGNITMNGSATADQLAEPRGSSIEDPAPGKMAAPERHASESGLLKRKKSTEDLQPNKQQRIDQAGTPAVSTQASHGEQVTTGKSSKSPSTSPSATRRRERAPSFSGLARRLSFSERPQEFSKPGLGLGITKSPPKKEPVMLDLSQDSPGPSDSVFSIPNSAPIPRWGFQNRSSPSKSQASTPANKAKQLQSAMRKDSPVERSSERRSVSFAEGDDVFITGSGPAPMSAPQSTAKPSTSAPSERRRPNTGTIIYPDNVSKERLEKMQREAEEKIREKEELEEKIKIAEEQKLSPQYTRKLNEAYKILTTIRMHETRHREKALSTLRPKLQSLRQEIAKIEEAMDKTPILTAPPPKRGTTTPIIDDTTNNVASYHPPMGTVHRVDVASRRTAKTAERPASKKPTPSKSVELSSSSESEESESECEEETDSEEENQPPLSKADLIRRSNISTSQSSAKPPTSSRPAPLQTWSRPSASSQIRPSLKSLKVDQKKEQLAKTQPKRATSAQRRHGDIFDGPSDSDSEESESESESGSDSESGSSDDGDIHSSGKVGKLRNVRRRSRT